MNIMLPQSKTTVKDIKKQARMEYLLPKTESYFYYQVMCWKAVPYNQNK